MDPNADLVCVATDESIHGTLITVEAPSEEIAFEVAEEEYGHRGAITVLGTCVAVALHALRREDERRADLP